MISILHPHSLDGDRYSASAAVGMSESAHFEEVPKFDAPLRRIP